MLEHSNARRLLQPPLLCGLLRVSRTRIPAPHRADKAFKAADEQFKAAQFEREQAAARVAEASRRVREAQERLRDDTDEGGARVACLTLCTAAACLTKCTGLVYAPCVLPQVRGRPPSACSTI